MVDLILLDKEEVREIVAEALRRKGYAVTQNVPANASGAPALPKEATGAASTALLLVARQLRAPEAAAIGAGDRLRKGLPGCSACCAAAKAVETLQDLSRASAEGAPLYRFVLRAVEQPLLESALAKTGGNQLAAAKLLGINRNTLRARLRSLGIRPALARGRSGVS